MYKTVTKHDEDLGVALMYLEEVINIQMDKGCTLQGGVAISLEVDQSSGAIVHYVAQAMLEKDKTLGGK